MKIVENFNISFQAIIEIYDTFHLALALLTLFVPDLAWNIYVSEGKVFLIGACIIGVKSFNFE